LLRSFARAVCPSAPEGVPSEPREDTPPDGGGLLVVLSGLHQAVDTLLNK